ncbi:hypothetical protein AMK11_35715 [Streptomyces sp. CB02414]|nr:hypothetical protein AMK11_35715 [Streptomyces sp. CB02414]
MGLASPQCFFPIVSARARSPPFSGRIRSARQRRWEIRVWPPGPSLLRESRTRASPPGLNVTGSPQKSQLQANDSRSAGRMLSRTDTG